MPLFSKARDFDLDGYLSMLPQWRHLHRTRPALALPWVRDGLQDWPSALGRAKRIVGAMTPTERHNPEEITLDAKARIASVSGADPDVVDRLLSHFFFVKSQVRLIQRLNFRQRLKLITGWGRFPLKS